MPSRATDRLRLGARLLRAVMHSPHPAVQALVREVCPTIQDTNAVFDLVENMEAGVTARQPKAA